MLNKRNLKKKYFKTVALVVFFLSFYILSSIVNADDSLIIGLEDGTAPTSTLELGEPTYMTEDTTYVSSSTEFTLSAIDNEGGLGIEIFYKVDDNAAVSFDSDSGTFNLEGFSEGIHTILYWSKDVIGNTEDENFLDVIIDDTAPATTSEADAINGQNDWYVGNEEDEEPQIHLSCSDGEGSGAKELDYKWDTQEEFTSAKGISADVAIDISGTHFLSFFCKDNLGNTESPQTMEGIKYDDDIPYTEVSIVGIEGKNGWFVSDVYVTLTCFDETSESFCEFNNNLEIVSASLDGAEFTEITGPISITGNGAHTLQYRAKDVAGNTQETQSRVINIDTNLPSTSFSINPSEPDGQDGFYNSDATINLECTDETNDCGSDTVFYSWDDNNNFIDSGSSSVELSTNELQDGSHVLYYYSEDVAGNSEDTISFALKLERFLPSVKSARTTSTNTINVTFSEDLDESKLSVADFEVHNGENPIEITITNGDNGENTIAIDSINEDNSIVTLTLAENLGTDATPTIIVNPNGYLPTTSRVDLSGIVDLSGNEMTERKEIIAEDGVAPKLLSARTTSTSSLEFTFSESIDGDAISTSDFTVDEFEIDDVSVDGSIVTIWLDDTMSTDAAPTVSIVEQQEGSVRDFAGNEQTSGSVVAADGVIPEFVSVKATSPTKIEVTFSEDLEDVGEDGLSIDDFEVYRNQNEETRVSGLSDKIAISSITEKDGVVTLILESSIQQGDNPQLTINPSEPQSIKDLAGNEITDTSTYNIEDKVAPVITISPKIISGKPNEDIDFSVEVSDIFEGIGSNEVSWTFGDNSKGASSLTVSHNYEKEGTYNVTATIEDTSGNIGSTTKTVYILSSEKIVANETKININENKTNIIVPQDSTLEEVVIGSSIDDASEITLEFTETTTNATHKKLEINQMLNISRYSNSLSGNIKMFIPANITITSANLSWNGTITLPTIKPKSSITPTADADTTVSVSGVIEVGLEDMELTFSKGVRLVLPGMSGKLAGYSKNGAFTKITQTCTDDTQATGDALNGGECKIDADSDLVIWTMHFTRFGTYTQTNNPTQTNSGSTTTGSSSGGFFIKPTLQIPSTPPETSVSGSSEISAPQSNEETSAGALSQKEQTINSQEPLTAPQTSKAKGLSGVTGRAVSNLNKPNVVISIIVGILILVLIYSGYYYLYKRKSKSKHQ